MNKEKLTWGPNDDQGHLGPFSMLCVTRVGPNKTVSCEIRE